MPTHHDVQRLRELYRDGRNLTAHLREMEGREDNSLAAITYAYDLQAGSYVAALDDPTHRELTGRVGERIAGILDDLEFDTLLDAGTGEATTLAEIVPRLASKPSAVRAFDISLSRLLYAKSHLASRGLDTVALFTGELSTIPLADSSVDVVLTVHALEPNGGREREVLAELLRVSRRYLVLVEPSYERGSDAQRARMDEHGYVRGLADRLRALGATIVRDEPFGLDTNPDNAAAVIVVDNGVPATPAVESPLVSPLSGASLRPVAGGLFSDDGYVFPVIEGIPCLRIDNAVLAAHLGDFQVGGGS